MRLAMCAVKTVFVFCLFIGNTAAENYIFDSDVRIIDSDESGITFTYFAPEIQFTGIEGYPENYKVPVMTHTAQERSPGKPMLPVKVVPVGVPFNSNPKVTVISQDYNRIGEVEVANFVCESSENEFAAKISNQTPVADWPARSVYKGKENIIRGLRIVKINLAAAKVENGILYKAESITVRVDFNNSESERRYYPRPNGYIFDGLLSRIVANYNTSRNWRVHWPPIPFKTQTAQSPFDSSQVWLKLELTNSGVYRITRFELSAAGIDVGNLDPREIRIFYGGGAELPVENDDPRPQLKEIPIYLSGDGDGVFNDGDLLLFYADAANRYKYDESTQEYIYQLNHYTTKNVYWLTYGGYFSNQPKRWANIDGAPQGQANFTVDKFQDFIHQERELVLYYVPGENDYHDYFEWYWGTDSTFSANIRLSDVVAGSNASIKVKADANFDGLNVNNSAANKVSYGNGFSRYNTTSLNSGDGFNSLLLHDNNSFYLDFIDVYYSRWLDLEDNQLKFNSPDSAGLVEYRLTAVPSDYMLIDVTYPDSVSRIVNGELSGDVLTFHDLRDTEHEYFVFNSSAFKTINSYSIYEPDDLRSTSNEADYILITPEIFYDQSLELALHRQTVSPDARTRVVLVEDIYNQFGWGLFDPLAIRDFLKYAYENWAGAPPGYVVLVGDGHFDYRNNLNSAGRMLIPPFEANIIASNRKSYGSDANYIYFGDYGYLDSDDDEILDMIIGRLPVNDNDQMDVVLNKIINYEVNPDFGKWRNNVIIVADDNLTNDHDNETIHTSQAQSLASSHVPGSIEVQKIYLLEYPIRTANSKPDAREALIKAFNDGGLIVNWIGHGNKGLWAHEAIFRRVEDMPRLQNGSKLALVFAASCSIGFFDHPTEQGMAEDFVKLMGGGGIASIGATRLVYATSNFQLNSEVFDQLLFGDSISFGEALYQALYLRQVNSGPSSNDRKYMLFGDPALISGKPTLEVEFSYSPDSLVGLTADSIAGTIYNDIGQIQADFNGTVWVLVKDAQINRHKMLTNYAGNPTSSPPTYYDYTLPGPTIFNGPAHVVNGHFSTTFFVPKDITYGGTGARIYVYFENGIIDGSGVTDTLTITGGSLPESDSTGPTIDILYNNESLSDGLTATSTNAVFEARIYDEHGINITGSMGHGIVLKIDEGDTYISDITDNFVFDMGDWQQGSAVFQVDNLPIGEHQLTLKAWDNYNNSTLFTAYIQVFADDKFSIEDVMNYPNPVVQADSTRFQYMLSHDAEKVSLKIFTLTGRKVRSIDLNSPEYISSGYRFYTYNLRDSDNDRLASGVYIYKIEAVGAGLDNKRRKSSFQSKLVILR